MKSQIFEWKLDPIAVSAFLLSLFAALAQLFAWWNGSSIRLITPDRVALYTVEAPDGSTVVRIAAPMAYANVAQGPYGDLVTVERASLSVGNVETRQRWNAFGTISADGIEQTGPATPQSLPGQSAVSHFTLFTPVPVDCVNYSKDCNPTEDYLTLQRFTDQIRSASKLQFRFGVDLIGGGTRVTTCQVPLSGLVRKELAELGKTFTYAMCRSRAGRA